MLTPVGSQRALRVPSHLVLALAAGLCLVGRPLLARASVESVDEDEAPVKAAHPRRQPAPDEGDEPPLDQDSQEPAVQPSRRREPVRATPVAPAPLAPTPRRAAAPAPSVSLPPSPPAVALPAPAPKGPILLPSGGAADLIGHFRARQKALLEQNAGKVQRESVALTDLRATLDFPELFSSAAALDREAGRELGSGLGPQALQSAQLAVDLAPGLPNAWWTLARAEIAAEGAAGIGKAAAALGQAAVAEVTEPRFLRANAGNLAISAILAGLLAGGLALALLLVMALRYALHDFHHLFPRAASPVQTALLGVILLAVPWLFHLGPFVALASCALAAWLYLQPGERLAATLGLACILAAPTLLGLVARWAALSPLGDDLYSVEQDLDSELAAARLDQMLRPSASARRPAEPSSSDQLLRSSASVRRPAEPSSSDVLAARPSPPFAALFALAHRAKRLGDLGRAEKLYREALVEAPGRADAENNLGNVLFLKGDLEGARASYEASIDHEPGLAAAYFNLGQDFNRLLLLDQSQQAQRHSLELDRSLVEAHMSGDDLRANRYLIDSWLPWSEIAGAGASGAEAGVRTQAAERLLGPLAVSWQLGGGAVLLLLLALSLAKRRLRPSSQCVKCGRPVCGRCDLELPGEGLCGQCVNVFIRRAVADPPARIRKEARVKAYQAFRVQTVRALSIVVSGAGHLATGRPLLGFAILWTAAFLALNAFGGADLLRAPMPGLWIPRLIFFGLLLVSLYGLSIRDILLEG